MSVETELPESVVADLRAAAVEHVDGMAYTQGPFGLHVESVRPRRHEVARWVGAGWVPDPRDRLTFLALCDVAERRGVDWLTTRDPERGYSLDLCRRSQLWEQAPAPGEKPLRPRLIAALARALAAAKEAADRLKHGLRSLSACTDCLLLVANAELAPGAREDLADVIARRWPGERWNLSPSFDSEKANGFSASPCEVCGDTHGGPRGEMLALDLSTLPASC